jgi:hypothetical protein
VGLRQTQMHKILQTWKTFFTVKPMKKVTNRETTKHGENEKACFLDLFVVVSLAASLTPQVKMLSWSKPTRIMQLITE